MQSGRRPRVLCHMGVAERPCSPRVPTRRARSRKRSPHAPKSPAGRGRPAGRPSRTRLSIAPYAPSQDPRVAQRFQQARSCVGQVALSPAAPSGFSSAKRTAGAARPSSTNPPVPLACQEPPVRLRTCDGGSGGDGQAPVTLCSMARSGSGPWSGPGDGLVPHYRAVFCAPAHQR